MNARNVIPAVLGILVFAAIIISANHWQHVVADSLPPREECADILDAGGKAATFSIKSGGSLVQVLGTGSMAPYIPAAARGKEPDATVVAFVVMVPGARFTDIRAGDVCIYFADYMRGGTVIHVAAQRDSGGWIMSGLHNARSEPRWRVTEKNFVGIAAKTFTWPQ